MIEVIVAEVTLSDDQKLVSRSAATSTRLFSKTTQGKLGVNAQASGVGSTFDAAAQGAQYLISGTNYSAWLQALTTRQQDQGSGNAACLRVEQPAGQYLDPTAGALRGVHSQRCLEFRHHDAGRTSRSDFTLSVHTAYYTPGTS